MGVVVSGVGVGLSEASAGPGGGDGSSDDEVGSDGSLTPLEESLTSEESELSPGLGDGSTLGDVDGVILGDALGPEIWSEPPLHFFGILLFEYQPKVVLKQLPPAIYPLLRQNVC